MKRYTNKRRAEVDSYKVGNLVILSTKDLKYQIVGVRKLNSKPELSQLLFVQRLTKRTQ